MRLKLRYYELGVQLNLLLARRVNIILLLLNYNIIFPVVKSKLGYFFETLL